MSRGRSQCFSTGLQILIALAVILACPLPTLAIMENVSLHEWEYSAFEKLLAYTGDTYPMTTKPLTRLEMAGILLDMSADKSLRPLFLKSRTFAGIYRVLARRVKAQMDYLRDQKNNGKLDYSFRVLAAASAQSSGRYVDGPYDKSPRDTIVEGIQGALTLSHSASLEENLGIYAQESAEGLWATSDANSDADVRLLHGYVKGQIWNTELMVGRDGLWWGPGQHAALILSATAPEFDMIKLSSFRPFYLPWVFKYIGRIRLVAFLTQLEKNRDYQRPFFGGMRATVSPTGFLDLGATRTIIFGGKGRKPIRIQDVPAIVLAYNEHSSGGREDTDQLAALDAKVSFKFLHRWIGPPFRDFNFYTEYGAESIHGYQLRSIANLWGACLDLGPIDVRYEWSRLTNKSPWYRHGVYTTGYRYKGYIIGDPANNQSENSWVQVSGYPIPQLQISGYWENSFRSTLRRRRLNNSYGLEFRAFPADPWEVSFTASYEDVDRRAFDDPNDHTRIFYAQVRAQVTF